MREVAGAACAGDLRKLRRAVEQIERCPLVDPLANHSDRVVGQGRATPWHALAIDVDAEKFSHQQALPTAARLDNTGIGKLREGVHAEAPRRITTAMASLAVVHQDPGHLRREGDLVRTDFRSLRGGRRILRRRLRHRSGRLHQIERDRRIGSIKDGARCDPGSEHGKLVSRHRAAAPRHVTGADHFHEPAVGAISRHHRAAGSEHRKRPHAEVATRALDMAPAARPDEHRGNLPCKTRAHRALSQGGRGRRRISSARRRSSC